MSRRPQTAITWVTRLDSVGQAVKVGDYIATTPIYSKRLTLGLVTRVAGEQSFEVVLDCEGDSPGYRTWRKIKRIVPWYMVVKVGVVEQESVDRIEANRLLYETKKADLAWIAERRRGR